MTIRLIGLLSLLLLLACSAATKPEVANSVEIQPVEPVKISAKAVFNDGDGAMSKSLNVVPSDHKDTPAKKHNNSPEQFTNYQGLSYWIERLGGTGSQRVTASTVFKNGDRIRFHLRSNRSGYLYVVTQGSSGRSAYLFPSGGKESEYIEANQTYNIPAKSSIVFDAHPGNEVVWLFLSKQPLPVKDTRTSNETAYPTTANEVALNDCGSKDLMIESPETLESNCAPKSASGSKDIMVEDDAGATDPTGYAVVPQEQMEHGALLSLRLVLHHE